MKQALPLAEEKEEINDLKINNNSSPCNANGTIIPSASFNSTIQRREYHNLSPKNNRVRRENKENINDNDSLLSTSIVNKNTINKNVIFHYLDSIKNIINNSIYLPEEKQYIIENNWISIIEEKLKDNNFLLQRHSHRLSYLIFNVYKTLTIFNDNKIINNKFPPPPTGEKEGYLKR